MPIFLAYLYGIITFLGLQAGILKPSLFWVSLSFVLLLNILFVWLSNRSKLDKNFFNFLISPFIFLLSGFIFLGFADNNIIRQAAVIFLSVGSAAFIKQLILLNFHKYQYKNHSLSTVSRVLNTTTIFFWFGGGFDLYIFLKIPFWIIFPITIAVAYLLTYQFFIINKIKIIGSQWFIPVIALLITELFLVVFWLPLLSAVKGLLVTSFYYFFTGIAQHFFLATLTKKTYWRYGTMVLFICILTLLTARWN